MYKDNMFENNALVIHGGGLVEPSKLVLMRIAHNISTIYDRVFIGQFSFESLFNPLFIKEYDESLVREVESKRGTYFGTSRGIDLVSDTSHFETAVALLDVLSVRTVIVAGGDGSSRQVAELCPALKEHGINVIFPVPLTIDGINGGLSIGINEAVRESIRQVENISSASLQTRDDGNFGVVIVELQGRNRDDIMANVLKQFCDKSCVADFNLDDLTLVVVPATIETDSQKLFEKVNNSSKRTLILVSEGATLSIPELKDGINRKVRSLVVGHPSQSNNMTTESDIVFYNEWVDTACSFIREKPYTSFSVAYDGEMFHIKTIDYYANLNPRNGQKAQLPEELDHLMHSYVVS